MIADYGIKLSAFQLAKHIATLPRGAPAKHSCPVCECCGREPLGKRVPGYKVSRQKNGIGLHPVHPVNHAAKKKGLRIFIQMNIAELCNAHPIKNLRQPGKGYIALVDLDPVALNLGGIEC